jgi:hypothetical protein
MAVCCRQYSNTVGTIQQLCRQYARRGIRAADFFRDGAAAGASYSPGKHALVSRHFIACWQLTALHNRATITSQHRDIATLAAQADIGLLRVQNTSGATPSCASWDLSGATDAGLHQSAPVAACGCCSKRTTDSYCQ